MALKRDLEGRMPFGSIPKILAQEYFSKPMHALYKACELAAYDSVKLDINRPALDLGCGNGASGSVFCRIMECDGLDLGFDLDIKSVQRASRRGLYKLVVQADARALPIKTGALRFVLCNSVLHGIHRGRELALLEVSRVLESGSQFVMTVATPGFTTALVPTRLFGRLGLHKLAMLYSRKMNERNGHRELEYPEVWCRKLDRVGLKVENCCHYFSGSEAAWWSVLAMRPFRVLAILRCFPRFIQRFAVDLTERLIRSVPRPICPEEKESGYLLIVARKV